MSDSRNRPQFVDDFAVSIGTVSEGHRKAWDFQDLDGYIREGEPGRSERAKKLADGDWAAGRRRSYGISLPAKERP